MFWLAAELPPEIPPACVQQAATLYAVPVAALVAILKQENGKVGQEYPRSTGIYFGPFQISSVWTSHFSKWGLTPAKLRDDPCANVVAAAYVLAYYKVREPDWPRAIARFNVGSLNTPERRAAGFTYAEKVLGHWKTIYHRWSITN